MCSFYSGNPLCPTVYNPVFNVPDTSDLNTLRGIETSVMFGQSVPSGNRQINSVIAPTLAGGNMMIHGPAPSYIESPVNNQIVLAGGAFITGNTLNTSVPITTPNGNNLIINPSGPSIDFTGHTLINVGGISSNPNYYPVVGPQVITPDTTPTTGATIPTTVDTAYTLKATITFANSSDGVSYGSYYMQTRGANIGGVLSAQLPYQYITGTADPALVSVSTSFGISGGNFIVVVNGVAATTIKWRVALDIVQQSF